MSDRRSSKIALDRELTIHCEFAGHGRLPIIFIPVWAMSSAVFGRQLDHFATSNEFAGIS